MCFANTTVRIEFTGARQSGFGIWNPVHKELLKAAAVGPANLDDRDTFLLHFVGVGFRHGVVEWQRSVTVDCEVNGFIVVIAPSLNLGVCEAVG